MTLKDDLERDRESVFLNEDEFASLHVVEKKEVVIIMTTENIEPNDPLFGLVTKKVTIHGKVEDLPVKKSGQMLEVDDRLLRVETMIDDLGMRIFTLTEKR